MAGGVSLRCVEELRFPRGWKKCLNARTHTSACYLLLSADDANMSHVCFYTPMHVCFCTSVIVSACSILLFIAGQKGSLFASYWLEGDQRLTALWASLSHMLHIYMIIFMCIYTSSSTVSTQRRIFNLTCFQMKMSFRATSGSTMHIGAFLG